MVDQSLILKIKQLRARGKTYEEISHGLRVSFSTISKALRGASNTTPQRSTDSQAPLSRDERLICGEDTTLPSYSSSIERSRVGMSSNAFINKATRLIAGSYGLYLTPINNPGPSLNLSHKNILSPLGKLVLLLTGIMLFIWFLRKIRGEEEGIY